MLVKRWIKPMAKICMRGNVVATFLAGPSLGTGSDKPWTSPKGIGFPRFYAEVNRGTKLNPKSKPKLSLALAKLGGVRDIFRQLISQGSVFLAVYGNTRGVSKTGNMGTGTVLNFGTPRCHGYSRVNYIIIV